MFGNFRRRSDQRHRMEPMKRNTMGWLWAVLLGACCVPAVHAQNDGNLGDYARQVRKQKAQAAPATKKFDNDNLPSNDKLSVVGEAPAPAPETDTKPAAQTASGDAKPTDGAAAAKSDQPAAAAQPAEAPKDPSAEKQKAN